FTIYATSGYIKVGNNQFNIDPANPPAIRASVDANGNVVIPTAGIMFPETVVSVPGIGDITVRITPQSDGMGTLNTITRDGAFSISIRIQLINRLLGSNCGIGPVTAVVTTGDSGSLTGVPYDQTVGTAAYVNNEFAVPRSSGCGLLGGLLDAFAGL